MRTPPMVAVMAKVIHHHFGARFSTAPEIRSVSQAKLRRFKTNGCRANGRSTAVEASSSITSWAVVAASINVFSIVDLRFAIAGSRRGQIANRKLQIANRFSIGNRQSAIGNSLSLLLRRRFAAGTFLRVQRSAIVLMKIVP